MRVVAAAVLGAFLAVATVHGQRAEFEVATVKLSPPVPLGRPIGINLGTFRNGTLTMTNVTLTECVLFAYSLVSQDQVIGPDWIRSRETRFDIVAKAPDVDVEGARRMLRSRPYSFVAVVPAKGGAKLTPAVESDGTPGSGGPGQIVGRQMPMSVLMSLLSRLEGQLFVDKTGLTGRYQIRLEWVPENDPTRSGASLSEALQEQLGLRMERKREPLDVIVVQAAERTPTDN